MRHEFRLGGSLCIWMGCIAFSSTSVALAESENVLIIVADDLGVDILECYGVGTEFPPTPTIDGLRESGILFRRAYSDPTCSPTRATIQTGRYGFRTGVGGAVDRNGNNGLPITETIIPEILDLNPELGYAHAAIGKWHLTNESQDGYDAPNTYGYNHFSGMLWKDELPSYYSWTKTKNGETAQTDVYATTDSVNEALDWILAQGDTPWFMWLAFNAPHSPIHIPPDDLHTYDLTQESPGWEKYRAMVQAMDTEMGRLFASLPAEVLTRTNIVFLADNGTPQGAILPPFDPDHGKKTLYEGGINVPLIIAGPQVAVPNSESDVLVNTTDLFATVLEIMGVDVKASFPAGTMLDSLSILPVLRNEAFEPRSCVYSEVFNYDVPSTDHGQAVRNEDFKLIRFSILETEEFYDLSSDPFETTNLLLGELDPEQQASLEALVLFIDELLADTCDGDTNGDGVVDPLDAGLVLARFGCSVGVGNANCDAADQNGDGEVDPLDVGYVSARFGDCH